MTSFVKALKQLKEWRRHHHRHPAQVTSDRLLTAIEKWGDKFDGAEHDMIGYIRHALEQIADGDR